MVSKKNLLLQGAIFRVHVKLWEGIPYFEVVVIQFPWFLHDVQGQSELADFVDVQNF